MLTAMLDRLRRGEAPGSGEQIAAGTAWPGARTYGIARTRRFLLELAELGLAQRICRRGRSVRSAAL